MAKYWTIVSPLASGKDLGAWPVRAVPFSKMILELPPDVALEKCVLSCLPAALGICSTCGRAFLLTSLQSRHDAL